jgi:hypothetical protein
MRTMVPTETYLSNFGVNMKQAISFILSNLDSPLTIYNAAKQFRLTTTDLLEIAKQDFPDLTSLDVARYFSGSGLNPAALDIPSVRHVQQLMNYQFWNYEDFFDYQGTITKDEVYKGGYDLIAAGDLNHDGNMDLVIGFMTWNDVWDTYPIEKQFAKKKVLVATHLPEANKFVITNEYDNVLPLMYWTQTGMIGDFNRDGFNDLILVGTGPDQGVPRGEMPYLLLGSPNGLTDASDILPRKNMYTHQSVFADFNNDGKLDLFLINQSIINQTTVDSLTAALGSPYAYMNEAVLMLSTTSGWTEQLVTNEYLNNPRIPNNFSTAIALDFNGDGNLDLALAGSNYGENAYRIMLLRGDGEGGFQEDSTFSPVKAFGSGTVFGNMNSFDFNGDGSEELLLVSTNHTGQPGYPVPWGGAVFQAFERNKATGQWTDVTPNYLPTADISNEEPIYGSPNKSLTKGSEVWVKKTFFMDVDRDGDDDMILSTIQGIDEIQSGKVMPRLLINNEGIFEPTPLSALTMSGFGSLVPYEVDGGGLSVIGASNVYGGWGLNIFVGEF